MAAWDRRWAALLKTDDVASEAEAEVARIVPWYLLSRDVDFAPVSASARSVNRLVILVVVFVRQITSTVRREVRILLSGYLVGVLGYLRG